LYLVARAISLSVVEEFMAIAPAAVYTEYESAQIQESGSRHFRLEHSGHLSGSHSRNMLPRLSEYSGFMALDCRKIEFILNFYQ